VVLSATSAHAQATRTWVSGVGDDANPCSRTAPCKTFAGAISKTAPNGEINVLDPGGFGGVTITKSITISSEGFEAGVLVSGTNGIIVNAAATDEITLKGLDIEGLGSGLNGVNILSASKVHIIKCSIHNFTQSGVNLAGPTGARVVVQDSIITSNLIGVTIAGASGAANTGLVLNTTIDNNTGSSIQVGAGSTLILGGSRLIGSANSVSSAGTFTSFGDNAIQGTGNPNNTIQLR
jgi:hypothetical protein